jgi:transposase
MTFVLTAGQAGDAPQAIPLLERATAETTAAVLGDRAYDSDEILNWLHAQDIEAVIPARANRVEPRETDWSVYKWRSQIEVMFGFLKHYRRVFSRFDKLARRYLAFVHIAAVSVLLR